MNTFSQVACWVSGLLVATAATLPGDVRLPAILSDHMVLQAGLPVSVWGWADPAEEVTVSIGGRTERTVANAAGKWEVKLPALEQTPAPATLTVSGRNTLKVEDVLIGEVWLGSGQSNMQLPVSRSKDFPKEKVNARFPAIRMFTVGSRASEKPGDDVKGSWEVCSPETVARFSATLYFFGREVHQHLRVPVGLVNVSWGGTPIQSWMPLDSLKASPNHDALMERKKQEIAAWPERSRQIQAAIRAWEEEAAKGTKSNMRMKPGNPGPPDSVHYLPGRLYNGMIHPLIGYRMRGVLWYQGEANARDGATGAAFYADLQPRLFASWRSAWGVPDLPFLFVQLPNYDDAIDPTKVSWAYFREAQSRALSVSNTGMAVTIDLGEAGDIHPKNKQDVGHRLASIALADVYHLDMPSRGPVFHQKTLEGGEVRLSFSHSEGGLMARGNEVSGFLIAGADREWYPAAARVEGGDIVVSSPKIRTPVEVRYGWANNPECNIYNRAGLPLVPFRTDSWN